jgi:CheY-like chemotaxis protein
MGEAPDSDARQTDLSALTILAVDDNASTLRLVAEVLRASGFGAVHCASTGLEALTMLEPVQPDVLLVDWQMPKMDGLELTRVIRSAALRPDAMVPNPTVPIVMLTARRRLADVEMARLAGVSEFIAKPFTPGSILSRVQSAISRGREFVVAPAYVGPDRRRRRHDDYAGPMRRTIDPETVALEVERDLTRRTIRTELDALRNLVQVRGGSDRETLQMCYRSMQHNIHRAQAVRDTAIEQASNSLVRYMEAMGGPVNADPKVVEVHMDALGRLLTLGDLPQSVIVTAGLKAVVEKKLSGKAAVKVRPRP